MRVAETRVNPTGIRRRRRCVESACAGRITTIEIQAPGLEGPMRGKIEHMLVPVKAWRAINTLAQKIRGGAVPVKPGTWDIDGAPDPDD